MKYNKLQKPLLITEKVIDPKRCRYKKCLICDKDFIDNSHNFSKETCSNKCRLKLYYKNNPNKKFNRDMYLRFNVLESKGVTLSDSEKDEIYEKVKKGICEICGEKANKISIHIDHDHTTNKYRGVICRKCNQTIGYSGDSPPLLIAITKYLIKHSSRGINWSIFLDSVGKCTDEKR